MPDRTGIELLPTDCRIVGVPDTAGSRWGRATARAGVQVRAFRSIPFTVASPALLSAELRRLLSTRTFPRRAIVGIWGLPGTHHFLQLPPAEPADLESLARREARAAGALGFAGGSQVSDGLLAGPSREWLAGGHRRDVCYVAVSADEVRARLRPIVDAGFTVDRVVTPAIAHASIARLRPAASPDAVMAVLEINARVTGLTITRGGVVVLARELPWGHESDRADPAGRPPDPQALAARLAADLRRSLLYVRQHLRADPVQIIVCGDMPDMRTITAPLMQELDVEVEILDSMAGIDAARLPEPAEEFRARVAEFMTPLAIATVSAPIDLRPREARSAARSRQAQGMLVRAALIAALTVGAGWTLSAWLASGEQAKAAAARRQLGMLEPQLQRLDQHRLDRARSVAQEAALQAFATQGPRVARVLEALGRSAPGEVAITSLTLQAGGASWRLRAEGQAVAADPALAQAAFTKFLRAVTASPLLGQPVSPPLIRMRTEAEPTAKTSSGVRTSPIVTRDAKTRLVPDFALRSGASRLEAGNRPRGIDGYSAGTPVVTGVPSPATRPAGSTLEFVVDLEVRK